MEDEDKKKIYGKGYEEGLKDAWSTIVRLTTRGHSVQELRMISRGNLAAIPNQVTERVTEVDPSKLLPKEEPTFRHEITRPVEAGRSYLVEERRPDRSFLLFTDFVQKGAKGLCVARIHPEDLRERYGMEGARLVWLTGSEKKVSVLDALGAEEEFISPTDLASLASTLIRFMEEGGEVLILEGLEYLITQNSFSPVLKFLMRINEKALVRGVTLFLSIDSSTMDTREYQLLSREIGREI